MSESTSHPKPDAQDLTAEAKRLKTEAEYERLMNLFRIAGPDSPIYRSGLIMTSVPYRRVPSAPLGGQCPYCAARHGCEHLVLRVDVDRQRATDGLLATTFDGTIEQLWELAGEPYCIDYLDPMTLLRNFTRLVDVDRRWRDDSAPNTRTAYWDFFLETPARLAAAKEWLEEQGESTWP